MSDELRELNIKHSTLDIAHSLPERVLVVGLGTTGVALVKFLSEVGRKVTVTDVKGQNDLALSLEELAGVPFESHLGGHRKEDFLDHQLIVVSPGVQSDIGYLRQARAKGARVIGEIELASAFIREPIIGITGTNGKTTTTSLLGEIFAQAFSGVFVGGNIGNPLINYVRSGTKADWVIAEVSSFQLETIDTFRPHIAILLNITEDHLDRYPSFDSYAAAKWRIFENQTGDDYALLNSSLTPPDTLKAKTLYFSITEEVREGACLKNGLLHISVKGQDVDYRREISPLVGDHNSENLLAVLLASHLAGINRSIIEPALAAFNGLPHRVEFVRETGGVRFFDDSKATNVDAAKRALESIEGKVVLIAGGKDKGGSYEAILPLIHKIKAIILFGEAKDKIEKALGPYTKTYGENSLGDAVKRANSVAGPGETVLFSPMCSSFDMFKDYKERGTLFKEAVWSL
jgi:UDP-N-acetylmuramoylalanine--D-glutamate ligase